MSRRSTLSKVASLGVLGPLLRNGMTIGIGGFGLDRKPMVLVQEIARSDVGSLVVETYAGALDVELLVAAGKVSRVSSCHVGLDQFGLAPIFRRARQEGVVEFEEWSELSQLLAWRAAAEGVSSTSVRMDPETDLLRVNKKLQRTVCGFTGDPLICAAAPRIDLAILHAEAAHPDGSAIAVGDPYLDDVLARAARVVVLSTERLIDDFELESRYRDVHLIGNYVDHVIVSPGGAAPGSCIPEYLIDWPRMRRYAEAPSADSARVLRATMTEQNP